MNGFFITGTDTNVGKTILSALLVAALDANYWKPIQTGSLEGTDTETVRRLAQARDEQFFPEAYKFEPPVSPHIAAHEAGVRIRLGTLPWPPSARGFESDRPWIVEGAGGALVPINESETMIAVMRRIGLPVVIASRTSLGTINHTMLTLAALRSANLLVHGVVMNGDENAENRRAIEHYGQVRVLGRIPRLPSLDRAALLHAFESNFDRAAFSSRAAALGHSG
jgi:dethiobiotin synthetase